MVMGALSMWPVNNVSIVQAPCAYPPTSGVCGIILGPIDPSLFPAAAASNLSFTAWVSSGVNASVSVVPPTLIGAVTLSPNTPAVNMPLYAQFPLGTVLDSVQGVTIPVFSNVSLLSGFQLDILVGADVASIIAELSVSCDNNPVSLCTQNVTAKHT